MFDFFGELKKLKKLEKLKTNVFECVNVLKVND